jgi:uncharacterized membrane protein
MSKTWKWIIGILIGLLLLAVIVAIPFGMHQFASGYGYAAQFPERGFERGFDRDLGPGMMGRGAGNYYWHHGMMGGRQGYINPMMNGFGFFPFGILMWIVPLAVLGLAIYGMVALFSRKPSPAVAVETAPAAPTRTCSSCGKPAQDEWKNCPHCGSTL